jgi:hypothetical protein
LLYAGTTYILSFKYSLLNDKVKKLKLKSISAGNQNLKFNLNKIDTSETLRNETVEILINTENIKPISNHIPSHLKPVNENQFGHYLAGLIDGDGQFSSQQQLVLVFHSLDANLAYYIKEQLECGNVKKINLALLRKASPRLHFYSPRPAASGKGYLNNKNKKAEGNKNAFLLVISSKKGLEKVINLINGKIRTKNKFNQITKNILNHKKFAGCFSSQKNQFNLNLEPMGKEIKNHWLAGFTDADGCFQIKIITRNNKEEIRLNFQIDQKKNDILLLIKDFFGGNIGYRKNQDTYYYGSTSFGTAKNFINYFDSFHLLSSKHINYLKWRKAYLIIQNRDHLKKEGLKKIIKLKKTMNRGLP